MNEEFTGKQHKRIVVLSASAIVFGLYAIYQLANRAFANGLFSADIYKGNDFYLLSACTLMLCGVVTIAVRSFQDEKRSRYLAFHDPLTGLANRRNFLHKIDNVLGKDGASGALILLNIRRLSKYNHSYGHHTGDELMKKCAERISFLFEEPNFVGVISPGVFGICIKELANKVSIEEISEQLQKALAIQINFEGQTFYAESSVSGLLFDQNAKSSSQILVHAEMALMEARAKSSKFPVIFNAGIQSSLEEEGVLEAELRDALEKEQLESYFQPLLAEDGETLIGFEALARWDHPTKGMISPGCFVPIAQSLNLTDLLGRQMMAKACQQIRPLGDLKISVNVTPDHFLQDDYVNQVRKLLDQTGVRPERLELEITETELLSETELASERINALRKLGVSVALDDFGTGYSGLSYINKLDVDRIKIDSSFVQEIEHSESARSMIKTIFDIAKERNFKVTAEGVETKEQFEFLSQFSDVTYQGYLFSAPMHYRDILESDLLKSYDEKKFGADKKNDIVPESFSQRLKTLATTG